MTSPRLTLSDAYRDTVEMHKLALTRPTRNPSEDVEINENAKHELQVKVSASRHDDETLAECAARAVTVWKETRAMLDGDNLPERDNGTPFDD